MNFVIFKFIFRFISMFLFYIWLCPISATSMCIHAELFSCVIYKCLPRDYPSPSHSQAPNGDGNPCPLSCWDVDRLGTDHTQTQLLWVPAWRTCPPCTLALPDKPRECVSPATTPTWAWSHPQGSRSSYKGPK